MSETWFTEEHAALVETVRDFCEKKSPQAVVRGLIGRGEGTDPAVWAQMARQLGLPGLGVPEEYGGAGAGPLELVLVLEELGASLACASYLSTAIATQAIVLAGNSQAKSRWLPGIAEGTVLATLAMSPDPDRRQPVLARPTHEGWLLDGLAEAVADGLRADLFVVAAESPDGPGLFLVDGRSADPRRTAVRTTDLTRPAATVVFDATPGSALSEPAAEDEISRIVDLAAVLVSAEQTGGARRCVDMATEYARTRQQFGRAIGDFQAIQHKCVEMLLSLESARAAVYHAAFFASVGASLDLALAAPLAKATCAEASLAIAADNIQVHGGIGFTWEHPAHLYFRRALGNGTYIGDARLHRELLVRRLGLPHRPPPGGNTAESAPASGLVAR